MEKIAAVDTTTDIYIVQEAARGEEGWKEIENGSHFWLLHQDKNQWRGCGIGISYDIFDSVVCKKCTPRGMLALVKLKNRGKILIGSLHCHTGVTNRVYQDAAASFLKQLTGKWRHVPCLLGVDANEELKWTGSDDLAAGSAKPQLPHGWLYWGWGWTDPAGLCILTLKLDI